MNPASIPSGSPVFALPQPPQDQPAAACISFEALAAALRHPALSSSPRIICTLLQVCKAWRSAVLAADACNTVISTSAADSGAPLQHISNLAMLATWLPRHAGCVVAISLHVPHQHSIQRTGCVDRETYTRTVQALLQLSLQAACHQPPAACSLSSLQQQQVMPAAPAATPASGNQTQQHEERQVQVDAPRCLQLQSFSSNFLTSPAVLAALPADSLTHLQLMGLSLPTASGSSSSITSSAAFAAALARLSSLRQLQLGFAGAAAASCLSGLSSLQQLTLLEVGGSIRSGCELLPRRLRRLSLQWDAGSDEPEAAAAAGGGLTLAHLTALSALDLDLVAAPAASASAAAAARLPAQLRALTITYSSARAPEQSATVTSDGGSSSLLAGLTQLQQLRLRRSLESSQQLLRLPALLPALQELSLEYCRSEAAVAAAPGWQLPQLQELHVWCSGASIAELGAITAGIAAASSLTCLELQDHVLPPDSAAAESCQQLQLLKHLGGLGQLQRLVVVGPWAAPAAEVAALMQQLPQLRHVQCEELGRGVSSSNSQGPQGQQLQDALAAVVTNLMAWAGT